VTLKKLGTTDLMTRHTGNLNQFENMPEIMAKF
jgi:hypothetical protein